MGRLQGHYRDASKETDTGETRLPADTDVAASKFEEKSAFVTFSTFPPKCLSYIWKMAVGLTGEVRQMAP